MNIKINDKLYNVIILKKDNKNMYLRIKDDLNVYITAPYHIKDKDIVKFIENNYHYIKQNINLKENKQNLNKNKFLFQGNFYDICYINKNKVILGLNKIFISKITNLDNFYKKEAKIKFKERLDHCYKSFEENIPYPDLKIRKMTSKWGVCNITNKAITLNLELIKLDQKYLDYVIIHELSHFLYGNHSKDFWTIVSKYVSDYKKLRKEMKNIL